MHQEKKATFARQQSLSGKSQAATLDGERSNKIAKRPEAVAQGSEYPFLTSAVSASNHCKCPQFLGWLSPLLPG